MTVGKRIKILRNNLNMTGKELSELTGINHGLIRKYETTNCKPRYSHIVNISEALNVRPYVLLENNYEFILETYGDLYGLFITLSKKEFISFSLCNTDVVKIKFNPIFKQFLSITNQSQMIEWENFNITVTDKLRQHSNYPIFIQWVSNKNSLKNLKGKAKNTLANLVLLEEQIETFELILQQSTELL